MLKSQTINLKFIQPVFLKSLIRIGRKTRDGGYIISRNQIENTKLLIGLGIFDDWSFEKHFKKINKNISIHAYDYSISHDYFKNKWLQSLSFLFSLKLLQQIFHIRFVFKSFKTMIKDTINYFGFLHFFNPANDIYFYQKGLSDQASQIFIPPKDLFNGIDKSLLEKDSIFIKMDIEGSEYDVWENLLLYSDYLNGMVIEFHGIATRFDKFSSVIDQLKQSFTIIHVHANNFGGYYKNTSIPNDLEITFMKNHLIKDEDKLSLNKMSYPIPFLDVANDHSKLDLPIEFI